MNVQECQSMQRLNVSQFFSVSTRLMAIGLVFPPFLRSFKALENGQRNPCLVRHGWSSVTSGYQFGFPFLSAVLHICNLRGRVIWKTW